MDGPAKDDLAERRAVRGAVERGESATWEPVVAFDRDSLDFVLGYELGRLDLRLTTVEGVTWQGTYHAANAEMIRRVAAARGWIEKIEPAGAGYPTWIVVEFTRVRT